jgi:hypothetical protein
MGLEDGQAVFLVDRPVKGKTLMYAPVAAGDGILRGLRSVLGPRAVYTVTPWAADPLAEPTHQVCAFARKYTQGVVTWLRTRPECGAVRLRVAYVLNENGNPHCSPQCEGAWFSEEQQGIDHEDVCECRCGGLRHNHGNPWWRRWEQVSAALAAPGLTSHEIRSLPGLRASDEQE